MVPNIEINPPSFTDNDVTVAPTLVVMNEQGQPIAKVAGVMNPEWVESEIEAGRRGDLGKHGQTSAIGEIDMMQAMIEKAKATDTKAMAERAKARIWQNLPMIPLRKPRCLVSVSLTQASTSPRTFRFQMARFSQERVTT